MAMEKFHFTHNGVDYALPRIDQVPTGVIRKTRKIENEMDKAFTIFEMLLGEDSPTLNAIDEMTNAEYGALCEEWTGGENLPSS